MSKKSSKPSVSPPADLRPLKWRMFGFIFAGVACVLLASFIAQRTGVGKSGPLDLKGARGPATVERSPDGVNRIRFEAPSGAIYRQRYDGGFGFQRPTGPISDITVAYDPTNPEDFQPAGVSYVPGAVSLLLFFVGMAFVLHARRVATRARRGGTKQKK